MKARRTDAGRDLEFAYEMRGSDTAAKRLLLIHGLGQQLVGWPAGWLDALVERGYLVAVFDNRDVGLSTHLDDVRADLKGIGTGSAKAPYLVSDLAADAVAVLDALGWVTANVLGVSLGGMIAQQVAISAPERVRTLTSIMSTTGDRALGRPKPGTMSLLVAAAPAERAAHLDHQVAVWRAVGSPAYPASEDELRARAGAAFDRSYDPRGAGRQFGAILASPDRTAELREVRIPSLVVHGEDDPLVDVSGGKATAAALSVSGTAELLVLPGMGHDLPRQLWPVILDALDAVTK